MATFEQCRAAVEALADRLDEAGPPAGARDVGERTLSCWVPDIAAVFTGRIRDGRLTDIRAVRLGDAGAARAVARRAHVRVTVGSDDLLALADGRLALAPAWVTGRVRVEASPLDLFRLRRLL